MKNIKVTDEVKMDVVNYLGVDGYEEADFYMNQVEDGLFRFYYYCMKNDIDLCDADRYANLNTVIGYDVGINNFREIDGYLWCEKDYDLMDLTVSEWSKQIVMEAVVANNLDVDFSKWRTEEPKAYIYYC